MFYVFSFPAGVYVGTFNLIASIPGPSFLTSDEKKSLTNLYSMASTFSILFSSLSLYRRNSSSGIEISVPDLEASYCEYRRKLTGSVIHCSLVSNGDSRIIFQPY